MDSLSTVHQCDQQQTDRGATLTAMWALDTVVIDSLWQCRVNPWFACSELQSRKLLEQKRRVNVHHSISYGQFQPEVCKILFV